MNFYKIPLAFLIWTVLYTTAWFWLTDWKGQLFSSTVTFIYLSYMCHQLYLLHKMIKKEKAEDQKMIEDLQSAIKKHETYVKQQIQILRTIEKRKDMSIRRLN